MHLYEILPNKGGSLLVADRIEVIVVNTKVKKRLNKQKLVQQEAFDI